jgi:hypothetical protein
MVEANVTIVTYMRDCEWRVREFEGRVNSLEYPAERLRVIVVEGDSVDGTYGELLEWWERDSRVEVIKRDMGVPRYGSVVDAGRFRVMSELNRIGLDAVDLEWSDYVLIVTSDVLWGGGILRRLIERDVDIVAPLVFMNGRFYDTWAFRKDGTGYLGFPQEMTDVYVGRGLVAMDSVGTMVLMKREVVGSGLRYPAEDINRGFGRMARERGFKVWCDADEHIEHPENEWVIVP